MGSLFGTSTSKPRKNLIYDEKYATMDYIPQSSSVGRIGGVSGGVAGSGNRAGRLPYTSVGSGMSHSLGTGLRLGAWNTSH